MGFYIHDYIFEGHKIKLTRNLKCNEEADYKLIFVKLIHLYKNHNCKI